MLGQYWSVCNFVYSIKDSLRKGITRSNNLRIDFRTDVFKFLFGGKGTELIGQRKKGRMYSQGDFPAEYFQNGWFKCYNSSQECCYIQFPIIMHSYVRFSLLTYTMEDDVLVKDKRDFKEFLYVSVVKKRSLS